MWTQWVRCEKCGEGTYNLERHDCGGTKAVEKLRAEFEQVEGAQYPIRDADWRRFRWKPFDEWAETPEGRFELFYLRWAI